jgi:multidrug resistance efflux pump
MCRAEHELAHTKADAQQQDSSDKARIEQLSQNLDATAHELQHLRALHVGHATWQEG